MKENTSIGSEGLQDHSGKQNAQSRWRRLIEDHRVSGLPVSVFCRERGIPQSSLFAWRRRLKSGVAAATFKPVAVVSEAASSPPAWEVEPPAASLVEPPAVSAVEPPVVSPVELILAGDRRLLVRPGFDRQLLLDVIGALESSGESSR